MNMAEANIVQEVLAKLEVPIIIIATLLIFRVLLKKFLDSLSSRGSISSIAKESVLRILDISIIVISFLTLIGQFIEVHLAIIALGALSVLLVLMLVDRIRGFIAYLALQMDRKMLGRHYMILVNGLGKPIYGKVTNISTSHCVVEDIFGERYIIPNTLMYNAILKPHAVSLVFDVRVRLTGKEDLSRLISLFRDLKSEVFRIDDKRSIIRYVGPRGFIVRIIVHPISSTIRQSDINDFIAEILEKFREYEIEVKFVEMH